MAEEEGAHRARHTAPGRDMKGYRVTSKTGNQGHQGQKEQEATTPGPETDEPPGETRPASPKREKAEDPQNRTRRGTELTLSLPEETPNRKKNTGS